MKNKYSVLLLIFLFSCNTYRTEYSIEYFTNEIKVNKKEYDYINGKITLIKTKELIKLKTRQYAKRQFTWARGHMRSWEMFYAPNSNDLFKQAINKIS